MPLPQIADTLHGTLTALPRDCTQQSICSIRAPCSRLGGRIEPIWWSWICLSHVQGTYISLPFLLFLLFSSQSWFLHFIRSNLVLPSSWPTQNCSNVWSPIAARVRTMAKFVFHLAPKGPPAIFSSLARRLQVESSCLLSLVPACSCLLLLALAVCFPCPAIVLHIAHSFSFLFLL